MMESRKVMVAWCRELYGLFLEYRPRAYEFALTYRSIKYFE